jgi:CRP/FNR family cyclic AMP-dependent transcriptional regulator
MLDRRTALNFHLSDNLGSNQMIAIPAPDARPATGFSARLQDLPASSAALTVALQGRMAVRLGRADGSDTLLRWLDDGELVALPDVLAHQPSPVSIVAQGAALTLRVERAAFLDVLQQHPDGAIGVAILLARRLGELFRYVELNSARSLADRVDFALRRLARSKGLPDGQGGLRLRLTQAELATAAGASRQRTHLALRELQAQGQLTLGYGTVTLLAAGQWQNDRPS